MAALVIQSLVSTISHVQPATSSHSTDFMTTGQTDQSRLSGSKNYDPTHTQLLDGSNPRPSLAQCEVKGQDTSETENRRN